MRKCPHTQQTRTLARTHLTHPRTHVHTCTRAQSLFCWHGSGSGNWHVILRTSLKNMSNTKHMSAGAAYGAGIYFSTEFDTSIGYCGANRGTTPSAANGWPKSRFKGGLTCMAMCEIIDHKEEFTFYPGKAGRDVRNDARGIYVVPKEEYVVTRFFFVNPQPGQLGLNSAAATAAGVAAHSKSNATSEMKNSIAIMRSAVQSGRLGFLS